MAVALVAVLLAAQVIRSALVTQLVENSPAAAARVWPTHPEVEIALGMTAIGAAAHVGESADAGAFETIERAASRSPLAPEPFLVRGVRAQIAGDDDAARRAFLAAEYRDPRSLPARYFLADMYFRAGDAGHGLPEFAALARLAPDGRAKVAPFIATYASDRRNWPRLRSVLRSDPNLQGVVLVALASDARNADAILALSDPRHRNAGSPWLGILLDKLVSAGQYNRARAIWANVAGVGRGGQALLFDAGFSQAAAPPPFNWALTGSSVGLAERQSGGRLHVIFYGQEQGRLARQLITLEPGSYRLSMRVSRAGPHLESLRWVITCAGADSAIGEMGLDSVASRPWTFEVPANCRAQWLELSGFSADIPQQAEATISNLSLTRVPANG